MYVAPKRDLLGFPVKIGTGKTGVSSFAERVLSPVPMGPSKDSVLGIYKEMDRLGISVTLPMDKISNIQLTSQEYDDFQRISGKLSFLGLTQLLNSKDYGSLSQYKKSLAIKSVIFKSRDAVRKTIFNNIAKTDINRVIDSKRKMFEGLTKK